MTTFEAGWGGDVLRVGVDRRVYRPTGDLMLMWLREWLWWVAAAHWLPCEHGLGPFARLLLGVVWVLFLAYPRICGLHHLHSLCVVLAVFTYHALQRIEWCAYHS